MLIMFNQEYADAYEQIHASKNYDKEIQNLISNAQLNKKEKIFDFGCGTGQHLLKLLRLGYDVQGYDKSTSMISKAISNGVAPESLYTQISEVVDNFDVVYSLFDVLSYQTTPFELEKFFTEILSVLNPGGRVIVDGWNATGVRADPPQKRIRNFEINGRNVSRIVTPRNASNQSDSYSLTIELVDKSTNAIITAETHNMRAWHPHEIQDCLGNLGVSSIIFRDVDSVFGGLSEESWRFAALFTKNVN